VDASTRGAKADVVAWEKATASAKAGCPISRLLNTTITMDAKLEVLCPT
jgi:osmotically inducible protein OsmC